MKITTDELLIGIIQMGEGIIDTRKLLAKLDISNGQFYQLRRTLIDEGRLIITHPCRAAHYHVPQKAKADVQELMEESTLISA